MAPDRRPLGVRGFWVHVYINRQPTDPTMGRPFCGVSASYVCRLSDLPLSWCSFALHYCCTLFVLLLRRFFESSQAIVFQWSYSAGFGHFCSGLWHSRTSCHRDRNSPTVISSVWFFHFHWKHSMEEPCRENKEVAGLWSYVGKVPVL